MTHYSITDMKVVCSREQQHDIPNFLQNGGTLEIENIQELKEFRVICENKDVTGYTLKTGAILEQSQIMDFIDGIEKNFARPLMGKVPSRYLDVLTETENLCVLDYRYGVSIGLRRLIEDFVIENYGALIHKSGKYFGKPFPSGQLKQLRNLNAKYILAVLSPSASSVNDLVSSQIYKGYKSTIDELLGTRSPFLKALLEPEYFDRLFKFYNFISNYLHGNGAEPSQLELKDGIELVMSSCISYMERGMGWGVQ